MPNVHLIHYGKDLELRGTKLDTLDKIDLSSEQSFEFYPNHRYLVVWNDTSKTDDTQPVKILQKKYHIHFGPRRETFYDYVKCSYLTTIDGIIFKFMYKKYELHQEWIDEEQYESMLPNLPKIKQRLKGADLWTGVSKKTGKQWYKFVFDQLKDIGDDITDFIEKDDYIKPSRDVSYVKRVRTNEEIENAFTYFLNKPEGTTMGLDYETHGGWPMDSPDFEPVGVGIACGDDGVCAYFDIQWMQYRGGNLEFFKQWYNKYLDKFENSVTYNNSFEQRATYLLLHRLCLFNEAAAVNKCDGLVAKRYSLKYTVQRVLGIKSWDDFFDILNDEYLPAIFKCTKETYHESDAWHKMMLQWSDEKEEFEYLIDKFWGDPFACIPSNIQTQYCCRDAYYTALLELDCKSRYSQLCWSTYNNNLRMEALLHLTGFFQDEDYRISLSKQCFWLMAHGYMNMVRFIAGTRIKEFEKAYGKLTLPGVIENLINEGFDIRDSKSWVMANLDDSTESGVSEELRSIVGDDLFNLVESRIREYCVHIDESYRRSRKVFTIIDADIKEIYNPIYDQNKCSWIIDGQAVVVEQPIEIIEEYFNSKKYLSEMDDILSQVKFDDINNLVLPHVGESNLPEKLIMHGRVDKELTPQEIFEYCSEICNLKSIKTVPPVQFMIIRKYYDLMLHFGSIPYGNKLSEDIDIHKPFKLPDDSLYKKLCDENYPPAVVLKNARLLMEEDESIKNTIYWNKYLINHDPMELVYMAMTDGNCFKVDSGKFDKNGKKVYERTKDAEDWLKLYNDTFFNYLEWYLIKQLGYFVARREDQLWMAEHIDDIDILDESIASLAKINWCYGSFKKYDKVQGTYLNGTHFTDSKIECDYFDEQGVTPNRYDKKGVFKSYLTFNANEKKSKRWSSAFHTIPSKSEMKRIVTTPPGYLMSYFDISGAEIRTISFTSGDPFMMQCYKEGKDPYITMAKFTYPDKADDIDYLKSIRPLFKMILLGCLYGMGSAKMAEMANISVETAEHVQAGIWERSPVLKQFIERKCQWAIDHPGYIESALGDVVELDENDGADRAARLGINQFIQNYASVSLADGFWNVIVNSLHHTDPKLNNKDFHLMPLGVVHDSCQIYFPTKYLFDMSDYYFRNLSEYLDGIHHVLYAFDLEIGTNYYDICDLKQLDPTHIQIAGNYVSVKNLVDKCRADGLRFEVESLIMDRKHQDPLPIEVNGFEFGKEFAPDRWISVVDEFFLGGGDGKFYARFNQDKSSFKMILKKV